MNEPQLKYEEPDHCLLCHEAVCASACPHFDPARILRALRFDNAYVAADLLPSEDFCSDCEAPCMEKCPVHIDLPKLMKTLRENIPCMEEAPNYRSVDLSCDICGVPMENPFLLSSSVVSSTYEMCARAFEMGWAGAAFKTISLIDIHEVSPRFSALKNSNGDFYGFKNIEQLSDHAVEENLEIFARLKKNYPTKVLIVSIMGRTEEEWEYLSRAAARAGADIIECNFSCPNMKDRGLGSDVGQDLDATARFTAAARRGTDKPLLIKLTPNVADMRPFARAAAENGADGLAAINTVKSITGVNLDTCTTAPAIRGCSSVGGYSGPAVKPIALRFISEMAGDEQLKGLHISGMGGIKTWRDAAEFLLLGAGSVQITTSVMEYGYRIIDDLISGLQVYMAQRGFHHVSEFIGLATDGIVDTSLLERDSIIYPRFLREKCVGCGRCYLACRDGGHQAIRFDPETRRPVLDAKKCVGCHLCTLVCPENAICNSGRRIYPSKS